MANYFDQFDNSTSTTPDWFEPGSRSEALARGLISGATLGLGNKAQALIRSATGPKTYAQYRDEEAAANRAAAEKYPLTTAAGNIVGGLPSALATGRAPIIGSAALGAAHGLGQTGKDVGEVIENIGTGAAIGGTVGAAGKAIGGFTQWLQNKFSAPIAARMSEVELAENRAAYQQELDAWRFRNSTNRTTQQGAIPKEPTADYVPWTPAQAAAQVRQGGMPMTAAEQAAMPSGIVAPSEFQAATDVAVNAAKNALPGWAQFGLAAGTGAGGTAGGIAGGWAADQFGIPRWVGTTAGTIIGGGIGGATGTKTGGGDISGIATGLGRISAMNPNATNVVNTAPQMLTAPLAETLTRPEEVNFFDQFDGVDQRSNTQKLIDRWRAQPPRRPAVNDAGGKRG